MTEAGRVALEYADDIFKKGEEFLQVFNQQSLSTKSLYRIGVVASAPKVVRPVQLCKWQKNLATIASLVCEKILPMSSLKKLPLTI